MTPKYQDDLVTLLHGDVRECLAELPAGSVHLCVTSPPYWGLRQYRTEGQVWGGKADCPHDWREGQRPGTKLGASGNTNGTYAGGVQNPGKVYALEKAPAAGDVCALCGAWRGELGLEPTPDLYVEHMVEVFCAVRRVLRDDGMLFLNLGDAYSGSGSPGGDFRDGKGGDDYLRPYGREGNGLKPLDLCNIPHRVAQALQADGWYWRQTWHWIKRSPMPESVQGTRWERCRVKVEVGMHHSGGNRAPGSGVFITSVNQSLASPAEWASCPGCPRCTHPNRPERTGWVLRRGSWRYTEAVEYVFLMAKAPGYTALQEQVREEWAQRPADIARAEQGNVGYSGKHVEGSNGAISGWPVGNPSAGRNPRNYALLSSEPQSVAHFATYPQALVEPFIRAATSDRGVCPTCGAQLVPVVEQGELKEDPQRQGRSVRNEGNFNGEAYAEDGGTLGLVRESTVLDYWPSCSCPPAPPVPAVVLDTFVGSGTTCIVARRLGRRSIGIDLSAAYLDIAVKRLGEFKNSQAEMQV